MKTDKAQLIEAIEAIKKKIASIEEQLKKPDKYKHFPSKGDEYYYYTSTGNVCNNTAGEDDLKVNVFKTRNEAQKAYNKAVAIEKIKRRLLELQGDWKPDFNDASQRKCTIRHNDENNSFTHDGWYRVKHCVLIPYMKSEEITNIIINEFHKELKLIFEIK